MVGKRRLMGVILVALGVGTIIPVFFTSTLVAIVIGLILVIAGLYLFYSC